MLHKEVNQSRLGQLWQVSDNLFVYQMEATGLGVQLEFYLLYHKKQLLY